MKFSLQSWNAILLGPTVLAIQYLNTPGVSAANRALAIGILFYLAAPVATVLIIDIIKIYQYYQRKN